MASAWGNSWGAAWGNSWGSVTPAGAQRRPRSIRFRKFEDETPVVDLKLLHEEDVLATDFIVALVTKGFFDGKS